VDRYVHDSQSLKKIGALILRPEFGGSGGLVGVIGVLTWGFVL